MRIIIEIEGDSVIARADQSNQQLLAAHAASTVDAAAHPASTVDAGSAPVDLLREIPVKRQSISKQDVSLNPLRAGEAIAREGLAYSTQHLTESIETIDAGSAPRPAAAAQTKPAAKRTSKKK